MFSLSTSRYSDLPSVQEIRFFSSLSRNHFNFYWKLLPLISTAEKLAIASGMK